MLDCLDACWHQLIVAATDCKQKTQSWSHFHNCAQGFHWNVGGNHPFNANHVHNHDFEAALRQIHQATLWEREKLV